MLHDQLDMTNLGFLKLLTEYEMTDLSRYKLQLQMIKRAEGMEDMMANEISQLLNMSKLAH